MPVLGAAIIDVIVSAIMIAFGIFSLYFLGEIKMSDTKATMMLIVSVALILAGGWLFISSVGVFLLLQKIAGLVLLGVGIFMLVGFPGTMGEYQPEGMAKAGILIGIILLIIGAYLLFF